jgi:hypothetical protein
MVILGRKEFMIGRLGLLANAVTWKRGHSSSGKDNGRKALTGRRRKVYHVATDDCPASFQTRSGYAG